MFQDDTLKSHLATSSVVKSQSFITAEWNMNFSDNIKVVGNYRYRPLDAESSKYKRIASNFDPEDSARLYLGATEADTVIDAGFKDLKDDVNYNVPAIFVNKKDKEKLLYSLEECFGRFRPRSGINKLRLGVNNGYTNSSNVDMASRPRYYMSDKNDTFKYWTSYRTEVDSSNAEKEYGISLERQNGKYYIDDAAPFVVYNEAIPANRVVVKMQTNVGTVNRGPFTGPFGSEPDPLYGYENQTTPVEWKIQYLDSDNNWVDAVSFNQTSLRDNGEPIIGADGYVEIAYGLLLPSEVRPHFEYIGEVADIYSLPQNPVFGSAYLIRNNPQDPGVFYYADGNGYSQIVPEYGWQLVQDDDVRNNFFVTKLTSPEYFDGVFGNPIYREFQYINGLRVVATTMNTLNSTLDLIELSPRLNVDISDMVSAYQINKTMSDLGVSGLPVGQLLASTGTLTIFDTDGAFVNENIYSIVSKYSNKNLQIKFYEAFYDVNNSNYYVPIKTMVTDGFIVMDETNRTVQMSLRDMFFLFESSMAPDLLLTGVSLSYAISSLLDSIGFSNYTFKRMSGESDPIIPYFYIPPETTVADVLADLAVSTQTAMFFDEYNNFVCLSKEYSLPSYDSRDTDLVLYGSKDRSVEDIESIISIDSQDMSVFNDGTINYRVNYIQKTYGSLKQAYVLDKDKTWIYKPALLWEVPADINAKAINEDVSTQSGYVLTAMPLNSDLSSNVPSVVNGEVIDNIIDVGEAVYWIPRYTGYFYANGEVIRYDAVEYSVPVLISNTSNATSNSTVWISSTQEYQEYFSRLPFNGKIYPTGRIRVYAEPNYKVIDGVASFMDGAVARHGRGQFNTKVSAHTAGLDPYWTSSNAIRGLVHPSPFDKTETLSWPQGGILEPGKTAGVANSYATRSSRSGKIKNFLSNSYSSETGTSNVTAETIQASAFILEGSGNIADYGNIPNTTFAIKKNASLKNFVSYTYKSLESSESKMTSFGTRMRIIGRIENGEDAGQSASGSMQYFTISNNSANQNPSISGGSGGIAVLLNPETNQGYYLEIAALSDGNIDQFDTEDLYNVVFYKVGAFSELDLANGSNSVFVDDVWAQSQSAGDQATFASTEVLWKGISNILVDDGRFTGQSRVLAEEATTVYDLAVEYEDFAAYRRFYIYLNGTQIATVDDQFPLPAHQSMAMFVRGSSKCMFEHVYALSNNYSENSSSKVDAPINTAFGTASINASDAFRKYAISGIVQSTYLSGISSSGSKFNIFYDEFGTILREAAYLNIRYDKAFPALYAKISPTFNKLRGYTVSGFQAGAYGAEFLVFNATDMALVLDETSGNYLRIQGVTFTQSGTKALTVDEYFSKNSSLSNIDFVADNLVSSPLAAKKLYQDIRNSRMTYGKNDFSLEALYVQTYDAANELMAWLMERITKPRLAVAVSIFSNPMIQLGDIVSIYYKDTKTGSDQVAPESAKFVVYAIDHSKDRSGQIQNVLYLSEVPNV